MNCRHLNCAPIYRDTVQVPTGLGGLAWDETLIKWCRCWHRGRFVLGAASPQFRWTRSPTSTP